MEEILVPVTRSRINKGFLAIPIYALPIFPKERSHLQVAFNGRDLPQACLFVPPDTSAKEARLLGLVEWFRQAHIKSGDFIGIEYESSNGTYTLTSDEFRRWRESELIRDNAIDSTEIVEAASGLNVIAEVRRTRPRHVAIQELNRLSQAPLPARRRLAPQVSIPRASVSPWMRAVLCTAYEGRCQICRFGFLRADGECHFEIHHIDSEVGDSPNNLLLLCPNCHAMLTFAQVTDLAYQDGWLVGLSINGRQVRIRQAALSHQNTETNGFAMFLLATYLSSVLLHHGR